MALRLEDIAPLTGRAPTRTERRLARGGQGGLSRRMFLARTGVVLAVIGTKALGILPPARQAFADGYDIWTSLTTGPCHPTEGYARNHQCSPGCGPSNVCGGVTNGSCCSGGWHKVTWDHPSGIDYRLRPNKCRPEGGGWDGWHWRCNSTTVYRCHDGWILCCLGWYKDICRGKV